MTYELQHDPPADERTGPSAQPRSRRPSRRLLFVYSCAIAALTIWQAAKGDWLTAS